MENPRRKLKAMDNIKHKVCLMCVVSDAMKWAMIDSSALPRFTVRLAGKTLITNKHVQGEDKEANLEEDLGTIVEIGETKLQETEEEEPHPKT